MMFPVDETQDQIDEHSDEGSSDIHSGNQEQNELEDLENGCDQFAEIDDFVGLNDQQNADNNQGRDSIANATGTDQLADNDYVQMDSYAFNNLTKVSCASSSYHERVKVL